MLFITIAKNYLTWHYQQAFHELFHVWLNFLWFVIHFFSLPQLSRSLFSPWRRMTEERNGNWNFEALAGYVIINLISRLIGTILRSTIIITGLVVLAVVIILGGTTFLLWFAAPVVILVLLAAGIALLVSNLTI